MIDVIPLSVLTPVNNFGSFVSLIEKTDPLQIVEISFFSPSIDAFIKNDDESSISISISFKLSIT